MPDALGVIKNIISQHSKVTEHVKLTGEKMNDIDAVFSVQRAAYKVAWSASSVTELLEKRDQLLQTVNIMEDGLKKHFNYEEEVLPLVIGELLMKDIVDAHNKILERIENAKTCLENLGGLKQDELLSKRTELIQSVNDLRTTVVDHAQSEEKILDMIKKVFEENTANKDR
jgi:urease gamma subunit